LVTWLRAALDLGASEVLGMDGDYIDPATLMIDPSAFIPADLAAMSLKEALGDRAAAPFDLVICMEVAEHLPHDRAPSLITDLASRSLNLCFVGNGFSELRSAIGSHCHRCCSGRAASNNKCTANRAVVRFHP
jgi:hypothetical protein